ncbi:uncharacterized protein [Acropora muricata]|uniref:uncharacterized protein isoform X1 n=2 Tax=Acropora muricata TaxID=159855 RepID=UPI0034E49865
MYTEHFQVILAIFLHINGLAFGQHSSQADVINNCTSSTSCIYSYEHVYQSFTKSDNSYNISYALYPGRLNPSSVHVFVKVYGLGLNKTKNCTPAQYTWSMSCLYAAIPSVVLEVLSLGAILVTPRTQELNLQIPLFCCNVSEDKEDRKRKIDEMLTRAIADLQDMAKSPGIRDPDLNTAECVIQGHKPNIDAPGVSPYIKPILWCSFFFVLLLGPIVTFIVFDLLENKPGKEKSANILCHFLLAIEVINVPFLYFSNILDFNNVPREIFIPWICIIFEGIVVCVFQLKCSTCGFCDDAKKISFYRKLIFIPCINLLSYHFCWLIVGIMLNPAWGLTVLFIVCFFGVALFFSLQQICVEKSKGNFLQPCLTIPAIFLSLCLVAVITVLAGQSFNGRETTNVVMKTALLYVVGGISWMLKKDLSTSSHQNNPNPNQNNSGHNPNQNNQGNLDLEGDPSSSGSSNAIQLTAMGASSA